MTLNAPELGTVQLAPGAAVWREVDGETVVLALASSTYLSLNPTGSLLWPKLAEGTTRTALIDLLADRFELARPTAADDVDAFIDDCRRRDLLS